MTESPDNHFAALVYVYVTEFITELQTLRFKRQLNHHSNF